MLRIGLNNITRNSTRRILQSSILQRTLYTATRLNKQHKSFIEQDLTKTANGIETPELIHQRQQRPISPHLTIYEPQLTWYMSSLHRVTLLVLGGTFYVLTILYGIGQLIPQANLNTDTITSWYHSHITNHSTNDSMGLNWVNNLVKGSFAYVFALQYGGIIRHLVWDTAKELSLKGVYRTGYALIGFSIAYGSYLLTL